MRTVSRTIFIVLFVAAFGALAFMAKAGSPVINAVTVENVDSSLGTSAYVKISFQTSESAIVWIDYGTTTAYGAFLGDSTYGTQHEIRLTGLASNTLYHFRITAHTQTGVETVSFDQTFQTKKIIASKNGTGTVPTITNIRLSHIGSSYAIFTWDTNVAAEGSVQYSTTEDFTRPSTARGSKDVTRHEVALTRLKPNTRYYYRILAKHTDGGQGISNVQTFTTSSQQTSSNELRIERISPVSWPDLSVSDTWITVRWTTNEPAKGRVDVKALDRGAKSGRVDEKFYETDHMVVVSNLTPNARYTFIISATSITGKRVTSGTVTLTTASGPRSPLLPQLASSSVVPTPRVAGATTGCFSANWTYGMCRNLGLEQQRAQELKVYLNKVYRNNVPSAALRNWYTLVNAYTYGGYPKEAIVKAVKFGGKTVHPTIPFSAWQNAKDYKDYISR